MPAQCRQANHGAESWEALPGGQARYGVPQAQAAYEAAHEKYQAAFERFLGTPATTLTGMAFKTSAIPLFRL